MKPFILIILCFAVCTIYARENKIRSGYWETSLHLDPTHDLKVRTFFNDNQLIIKNGEESIILKDFKNEENQIRIPFKLYESEIIIKFVSKKIISGYWKNMSKGPDYMIQFTSKFKKFKHKQNDHLQSFAGRWDITMGQDEKIIGEFSVKKNCLLGTFLTETGDYRYLEGSAIGDSMFLSCFDGSHAFLFDAILTNDTLRGEFLSGTHYKEAWFGVKNDSAQLRNPESITYIINNNPVKLSLIDSDNQPFVYPSSPNQKITILQIFGTWCPNCIDETMFLNDIYNQYQTDIDIVAIGFERGKTEDDRIKQLKRFKNNLDIKYKVVLGGIADKQIASALFPMLSDIIAFPTIIILNNKNQILKVHTGFSGPATGPHYIDFKTHLEAYLNRLIK